MREVMSMVTWMRVYICVYIGSVRVCIAQWWSNPVCHRPFGFWPQFIHRYVVLINIDDFSYNFRKFPPYIPQINHLMCNILFTLFITCAKLLCLQLMQQVTVNMIVDIEFGERRPYWVTPTIITSETGLSRRIRTVPFSTYHRPLVTERNETSCISMIVGIAKLESMR